MKVAINPKNFKDFAFLIDALQEYARENADDEVITLLDQLKIVQDENVKVN